MTVTTSKGKQYNALWIDEGRNGLLMEIQDSRRLPRIAAELDNLQWVKRTSPDEGDKTFEAYDRLVSITTTRDGLLCRLERSVSDG